MDKALAVEVKLYGAGHVTSVMLFFTIRKVQSEIRRVRLAEWENVTEEDALISMQRLCEIHTDAVVEKKLSEWEQVSE